MEKLKHFSHEQHPLILMQADVAEKSLSCHGCQTPIITSHSSKPILFSSCENCNFFLHKTCAELPANNYCHPMHPQHPLTLVKKPPYYGGTCKCHCCGRQSWSNFTYHCETCDFDMDILCAALEGRKLEHPGHQNALIPFQKRVVFECHACGETKEDALYVCSRSCPYWIHERSAMLPVIKNRKDHDHPLSLAYFLSDEYITYRLSCDVCDEKLVPHHWIYHCGLCRYTVHLKCIDTEKEDGGERIDDMRFQKRFLVLPTNDFAGDLLETYHSQRAFSLQGGLKIITPDLPHFIQKFLRYIKNEIHGHSVICFDVREDSNTRGKEIKCEACTDLIVSICLKRVNHSNYFIHVTCGMQSTLHNRLSSFADGLNHRKFNLILPENTWDFFHCGICNLDFNGYYFNCHRCNFHIDVKCALLPSYVYHEAHPHKLVDQCRVNGRNPRPQDLRNGRNPRPQDLRMVFRTCNGCGDYISSYYLECQSPCSNYHLGYECALLPKTASHRWDKHPLILSFPPFSDHPERFYCEVCEEEIHPLRWQYRCRECDQSFHPRCISQVSITRNIKFGIFVDVCEHPHTLKLIREAGEFRSTCHTCRKSLYGHRTFECAPCKFYLCHNCLVKIERSTN